MPIESAYLQLFSPAVWVLALVYGAIGVGLVWLAIHLAPWGLLILIPACLFFFSAGICGAVAYGLSRLEADPA